MVGVVEVGGNAQAGGDDLQEKVEPNGAAVDEAEAALKMYQHEQDNVGDQVDAGGENLRLGNGKVILAPEVAEVGDLEGGDGAVQGDDERFDVVEARGAQRLPLALRVLVQQIGHVQVEEEGRHPGEGGVGEAGREGRCGRVPGGIIVLE